MQLDAELLESLGKKFPYPVLILRPLGYQKNFKLPTDYTYKLISDSENLFEFRIKEIKNKESAMDWLQKYQDENKTIWRISRTFKCSGKKNVFKADYRCHHNTDKRFRGKDSKRSKNTNCEATLNIRINRYFDLSQSKPLADEVKEFPCYVGLNGEHNHPFDSPAKSRSRSSKKRSQNKEQTNEHGEMATSDNMVTDEDNNQEFLDYGDNNQEILDNNQVVLVYEDNNQEVLDNNQEFSDNNQEFLDYEDDNQELLDNNQEFSDDDDLKEFDLLINRIKKCRQENPTAFKPALSEMVHNAKNYAQTESSLLSALSNFANCTGPASSSTKSTPQRGRQLKKNVQPTARRKPLFAAVKNRKPKMRRKSLMEEHDYAVLNIQYHSIQESIGGEVTIENNV